MGSMDKMYKITRLGRQIAGKIHPQGRDPILDYLYSAPNKSATTSELEASTGMRGGTLLREIKELEKRGCVMELTGGG